MVKVNQQKHGKGKNTRNILKGNQQKHGKGNQQKHGKGKPAETW